MHLNHEPYALDERGLRLVEETYKATYMGAWCIKDRRGNWSERPVEVFYQPNPDTEKGHTNYFGIFIREGSPYICEASSAFSEPIYGLLTDDGEVIVSRYRHDCVMKDEYMIDGGRDYIKSSGGQLVEVVPNGNKFEFKVS